MDVNEAVELIAGFYQEKEKELLKTLLQQRAQIGTLTQALNTGNPMTKLDSSQEQDTSV